MSKASMTDDVVLAALRKVAVAVTHPRPRAPPGGPIAAVLIYVCTCVYTYIYIYTYRERERERERYSVCVEYKHIHIYIYIYIHELPGEAPSPRCARRAVASAGIGPPLFRGAGRQRVRPLPRRGGPRLGPKCSGIHIHIYIYIYIYMMHQDSPPAKYMHQDSPPGMQGRQPGKP